MKISVVICTKDRRDDLEVTLAGFYNQEYDNFEVIVIDNASSDGTKEMIIENFPSVKYTFLPININILAQNIGVYQATGDIIWRTDSDSHPENKSTFKKIVSIFNAQPDLDIITTTEVLVKKDFKELELFSLDRSIGSEEDGYPVKTFSGPGTAIRKRVFDKIGYYWEFGMEETDFSIRALRSGFTIKCFPDIRTLHYSSESGRNRGERWILLSNQNVRLIAKYYPLSKLHNLFICYFAQTLDGLTKRVNLSIFLQNSLQMIVTTLNTFRNERQKLSKEEFNTIIGEYEYYKGFIDYLKNLIK